MSKKEESKKKGKSGYIRRKVRTAQICTIYKVENGSMTVLEENKTIEGKVSIPNLKKEYNVADIHVTINKTIYKYYGIPVEEFMEKAVELETEEV